MIQGGGFNGHGRKENLTPALQNEATNGLKNDAAPSPWPARRTRIRPAQFFINLKDNASTTVAGDGAGLRRVRQGRQGMDGRQDCQGADRQRWLLHRTFRPLRSSSRTSKSSPKSKAPPMSQTHHQPRRHHPQLDAEKAPKPPLPSPTLKPATTTTPSSTA
jgi:hypothetical protein